MDASRKKWIGAAWIVAASLGFGSMALCARIARADGVDTPSLLMGRFVIGAVVLALLALSARGRVWPSRRELLAYLGMGAVYAVMALVYFSALDYAASSTVALLLYTFPIMVAAAAALLKIDRFGIAEAVAALTTVAGMAVMMGGRIQGSPLGIALGLASAVCYAGYILIGGKIGGRASPIAASAVVLAAAAVIYSVWAGVHGIHWPRSGHGWAAVVYLGLASTALAIAAFVAGLNAIGPTLASIISTLEPVVTVALGTAFLGEQLTTGTLFGGLLILGSALGLTLARMKVNPLASG